MPDRKINLILYICFFLSGIAGLIYEVLWAKYLSLIFGHTTYAHTLVLATFMGGLALGSLLLGRLADKVKDKLAFYAWVEIGIAVFCILTPKFFIFAKNVYLTAARDLSLNAIGIVAIKFIIGSLILLPPTILMGGTLPILSKFMIRSIQAGGKTVARLYYINSFGAVVGTILAGFYLIYHYGLECSITIAALINLSVGVTVIISKTLYKKVLLSKSSIQKEDVPTESETEFRKDLSLPDNIIRISCAGILLSGFVAMLYEVVWIRLLSMILGSSTYSFSLMLAAFISGITIGAFLISKYMPPTKSAFLFFGLCEILIGFSLIFSLPFYEKLPFLFLKISGIFSRTPETFLFYSIAKFFLSFLVMLPPTVFLGMTLPLVSKIASRELEFLGRKVGSVFAFNTSGNILGALVSGLVLLPILGSKKTLELGVVINLCLGLVILFTDRTSPLKPKLFFASICCMAFIGYKLIIPDWNKVVFNMQLFRYGGDKISFSELAKGKGLKDADILFYKDGADATVSVLKYKTEGQLTLFINGKADASTGEDMPTQILCAQLPLILKPDIKDVLVVGLGSGVTCGSALLHPIDSLDLIEISPSVAEANKYFTDFNYNTLQNKRLRLYIEDARTFMQRSKKRYDLIINEPSNPWMSGMGALFSKEYFNDCLNCLNQGGLMIQWVQAYEMDEEIFNMIIRTFVSVFPEAIMWGTGVYDVLLIGSNEKIIPVFDESENRITQQSVKEDLSRIELNDLFTLLGLQLASSGNVRSLVGMGGAINSDYFPILEYRAPLALYTSSVVKDLVINLDERRLSLEEKESGLLIRDYLRNHKMDYANYKNLYSYIITRPTYNQGLLYALVKKWHEEFPDDVDALLAYTLYNTDSLENAIGALEKLIHTDRRFELLDRYAFFQMRKYYTLGSFIFPELFFDVVKKLNMCIELSEDKKAKFYYLLGKIYYSERDYKEALRYYAKTEQLIESKKEEPQSQGLDYAVLLNEISFTCIKDGNLAKGYEYANKALSLDQENSYAKSAVKFIETQMRLQRLSR